MKARTLADQPGQTAKKPMMMEASISGLRDAYSKGMIGGARYLLVNSEGTPMPLNDKHGRANKVLHERKHLAIQMAERTGYQVVDLATGRLIQ